MNKIYKTPLTAMALIMSTVSFNVMADDMNELTGWQTPLAAEFSKLDTTGNGLLLPHEASKNRAFNKKTFAQADVDRDGYIDQNEYIHFKTGEWPATVQAKQLQPSQVQPSQVQTAPEQLNQEPVVDQSDADQPSAESSNSMKMTKELSSIESAAQQAMLLATQNATTAVSDDTVITHKAIATLLSTEELEGMKISVETYLGEVLLSGVVESQKDKMKAAYVVSKVDGVKSVKNELQVMS